jgi:hypothetical protein
MGAAIRLGWRSDREMGSTEHGTADVAAGPRSPAAPDLDLFVVHATADTAFVRGYLLPTLDLPPDRVLLLDELTPGALAISEIERGISTSRFTVVTLSGACEEDRWAVFAEQLASHHSGREAHIIPLRLDARSLPLRLDARVSLDFTDRSRWDLEVSRLRAMLNLVARPGRVAPHAEHRLVTARPRVHGARDAPGGAAPGTAAERAGRGPRNARSDPRCTAPVASSG